MSWVNDRFYYSVGLLRHIAENYSLYDPDSSEFDWKHWQSAIEFKADFDTALKSLGRRRQKVIKATMKKISDDRDYDKSDYQLKREGFYSVGKFRYNSFVIMCRLLNGNDCKQCNKCGGE